MTFDKYQKQTIAILAALQFSIILDFMILSPLGAILMPALSLSPSQFGLVVSAYAFSAGVSGILAAGFADRFDRKKMLLFFYSGFLVGTLFCALAPNFHALFLARVVTGLFGGVIGSVVAAITTDLFPMNMRGRVMGFVQTAFAATQVVGVPLSLYLANLGGWHTPFFFIVGIGVAIIFVITKWLKPIDAHLEHREKKSAFSHLKTTVTNPDYIKGFGAVILVSTGGFMLMPFGSAFMINNVGVDLQHLPTIYVATGLVSIILGPLLGKLADSIGKYRVFFMGSIVTSIMVLVYTNMGRSTLFTVILINVLLWVGITARIITSQAILSAVPLQKDRGAYMAISSSIQQISGGVASLIAGMVVITNVDGTLRRYNTIGNLVVIATAITLFMMYRIYVDIVKARVSPTSAAVGEICPTK